MLCCAHAGIPACPRQMPAHAGLRCSLVSLIAINAVVAGKRHAMASALKKSIEVKDSTLVVQYEVKASSGFACDG